MRIATAVMLVCGLATAQTPQVVLSEISPSGSDPWIELQNLTSIPIDISLWSIYQATKTPNQPQNYWFGLPAGTVVPPSGTIRVHWRQPIQTNPPAGEVYTGDTIFHFLFGYFAEPLDGGSGALALLRTQQNLLMNNPGIIEDWVSWGDGNFRREDLAAQNNRWLLGQFAGSIIGADTLARVPQAVSPVSQGPLEWFHDGSPTPRANNAPGAALGTIGNPCTQPGNHLFGPPTLSALSYAVAGNRDFGWRIANTSALLGEAALVVLSTGSAPSGQPAVLPPGPGPACAEYLDYGGLMGFLFLPTNAGGTSQNLSLGAVSSALQGTRIVVQAVILDVSTSVPPYQGATNALDFILGG